MSRQKIHIPGDFEIHLQHISKCMTSGDKFDNGHGTIGVIPYCCGCDDCIKCLPHRISSIKDRFSWANDADVFGLKLLTSTQILTPSDVEDGFNMLHRFKTQFSFLSWFRVALTGKHQVIIYRKNDKEAIKKLSQFQDFSVLDFYHEYPDYTNLNLDAQEELVINHKGKRRILGKGKTPPQPIKRCEVAVTVENKEICLKRKKTYVSLEEMKDLPKASYRPVKNLIYVMDDDVSLTYEQLLKEYIAGNYWEEYEEYLGKWDSQHNKKWFQYLIQRDKRFEFLNGNI